MELTERRAGSTVVLAPTGRIDMNTANQLKDKLLPLVTEAAKSGHGVVLDFSRVDYISSAGLRVLMLASKEARASGGKIAVALLQPMVKEIFQITRFDVVLPCLPGMDEALAAVAPAS